MMKLLWMMLAALPMQALANDEDPIAYKCYLCTPDEMEDVALAQGFGRHYVYDAYKGTIAGYDVILDEQLLRAQAFEPENWLVDQFQRMLVMYNASNGEMKTLVRSYLLAPDTEHARRSRYLWGHHLSGLHPRNVDTREWLDRFLKQQPQLDFLNARDSKGKLLRFEQMLDGSSPILVEVQFISTDYGTANLFFDYDSRRWQYDSSVVPIYYSNKPIQEKRDDFAPAPGKWEYRYRRGQQKLAAAFKERAIWAGIPVEGNIHPYEDVRFLCERDDSDIWCTVE